jgi:hypothetical protein
VQVGEFAVGAAAAYAAVGLAWVLVGSLWLPIVVAVALVAAASSAELRYGAKVTGLVVGVLPTAMLTAGLLTAYSLVITHFG